MFITITGMPSTGKSSVCEVLKTKYGFEIFQAGNLQRNFARQKGVSIEEHNKNLNSNTYEYDSYVDEEMKKYAKKNKDRKIVFDARVAWFFIKDSFKVYLTSDLETAARRAFQVQEQRKEGYSSQEEAYKSLLKRKQYEDERFKKLYGADCNDMKNFDLIIDTSKSKAEGVAALIIEKIKEV